jgi:tRNA (mo5U34)-methyltransferase
MVHAPLILNASLFHEIQLFESRLHHLKHTVHSDISWYPYGTLSNFFHLDNLLSGTYRNVGELINNKPVLDIGCADGDLGFFIESKGYDVDFIDYAPTNYNSLQGVQRIKSALESKASIFEMDIDSQFALPRSYSVCFCLGLLYHLKNPFYFLEQLSKKTTFSFISTKIFQNTSDQQNKLAHLPLAYLVDTLETNSDPTNFWIFTKRGLERLLNRSGWTILASMSAGVTIDSDPSSPDKDERYFALLKSIHA